ncbi:hypothetical protein [Zavarzinia compransoris]|uniref:Uncharacterized protein n=1 Tax=Zavarzinia compransoris TaxID=1264899 RepID=A0A317DUX4_9PROT|nr:hypothetical protein [Zavarzinia compransoris]PWR17780.1 hypothetical protein DKG75_21795 [Zavarzinia compransoris]TDP49309.1 hypothetical protein DES42_101681 [Zavarzinia compransoris]
MGLFRDLLAREGRRPRWLDHTDYCGRLLAAGAIPWDDVSRFIDWHRKAQGLLRPDVAALPLAPLIAAAARRPDLTEAMAARRRPLYPVKALLADEPLRDRVRGLLAALRATYPTLPLALTLPAPRALVAFAAGLAGLAIEPPTAEDADGAALYLADFLRSFGDSGIDALLLEEMPGVAMTAPLLAACRPVINIAGHYRWDVGLRHAGTAPVGPGFDFLIAPGSEAGVPSGLVLPPGYWAGQDEAPEGGAFIFAAIPADAAPEAVLGRLAALG